MLDFIKKFLQLFNSYSCPGCGEKFPLYIKLTDRVYYGFFKVDRLRCGNCGQISRAGISWKNAIWAWPLAAFLISAFLDVLKSLCFSRDLSLLSAVIILIGLFPAIFSIGRKGFILIPEENQGNYPNVGFGLKWFLFQLIPFLIFILWAYGTRYWNDISIEAGLFFLIYFLWFSFI